MRKFVIILFVAMVVWTVAAMWLIPPAADHGKTPLVWSTDPNPQREPQVEWFNRLYPDCQLRIDPENSDIMKVIVQSCAGVGPDIIGHVSGSRYQTYLDAGVLMDVTAYASKMGFGLETLPETVRPFVLFKSIDDQGNIVERQYVYPCNVAHTYILYNKNLFDRYGVPYPPEDLTWDQYIKIAHQLTIYENEGDAIPAIFGAAGVQPSVIMWELGGDTMNADGTRCTLGEQPAIDAMVMFHQFFFKHGVEPTPLQKEGVSSQGGWGAGFRNWFGEGRVGMLWGARWMLIQFRRFIAEQRDARAQWIAAHPDAPLDQAPDVLRMGACLVPRFEGGPRRTWFGARCAGINKQGPNREQAVRFLQFLAGEEYSRTINEGADSKPGNKAYLTLEQFRHPDWPEEDDVHRMSIRAVQDGYLTPRSLFVAGAVVQRAMGEAKQQITADPGLTREKMARIMQRAADKVNLRIARNIKRNPRLMLAYERMLAEGVEPIVLDLEEVE